ncbi:hypothetical protein [Stagnihabitans tardus]|uniref:Uncharacterized protein n=1 Tax=Stagnihabitans tardus TaxID=2699202 RepID=A0AAE4Y6H2_9RHOB|nr:hypothetical protein [Stagnihabitans tardus]NBZ86746.1 hypothetical protein [Stagnihabitans tardus]
MLVRFCRSNGQTQALGATRWAIRPPSPRLDAFIAEEIDLAAVPLAYARHLAGEVGGLKTLIRCSSR